MKRTIKFRAWHKVEKKLCPIDVLTTKGAFLIGVANGPDELTNGGKMIIISPKDGRFCMNEDIELMQFTGLHDKNGREIYEGDIVRFEAWEQFHDIMRIDTVAVEYREYGFTPFIWHTAVGDGWYNYEIENPEVIGNIWQNPELLSK